MELEKLSSGDRLRDKRGSQSERLTIGNVERGNSPLRLRCQRESQ